MGLWPPALPSELPSLCLNLIKDSQSNLKVGEFFIEESLHIQVL